MAFERKTWINRQAEFPNRRRLNPTGTADVYDVSRDEGLILEEGDPFNAATMNNLEDRISKAVVMDAVASYSDGAFTLSGLPDNLPDIFTVRFKAPADFAEGDTFAIGPATLTAKLASQEPAPSELFKSGAVVTMEVDKGAETAFFKMGGGGFPDGWKDVRTAEATEDIVKNQAISFRHYADMDALPDPSALPTNAGRGCSFSPDGTYLAVSHDTAPFITIYKRDGDTFTKLANPASLPTGTGRGCSFSPDGTYLAVAHDTAPFITIYKRDGDNFTKLPDPSALPTGAGYGCSFSPDGTYLSVAHLNSPFITIYKRDGDNFTKLANPASLPTGTGNGCSFSPDGTYLSVAHNATPLITIYKRSGDTFTKLPDPSALPTNAGRGCSFSPDGTYLAVSHDTAPFITIYKRDGDTFTKLANPASLPTGTGRGCSFSPDGTYLAVAHDTAPFITVYKRNGDILTKLANPSTLPTGWGFGCSFSPDGTYLSVAHIATPFITIYCTEEKDIVRPITRFGNSFYSPIGEVGVALQDALEGDPCKVNLFPALNNVGG